MINPIVKVCKKHGELNLEQVYVDTRNVKYCRLCKKEALKKYREKNKEKIKKSDSIYKKKYYLKNKENILIKNKMYKLSDKAKKYSKRYNKSALGKASAVRWRKSEIGRNYYKNYHGNMIHTLSDIYIKFLLTHRTSLKHSDITPELIELKRLQIQMKRQSKEMKNANN